MTFNIYDDCANTIIPDDVDDDFQVWDGEGRHHYYALAYSNVSIGEAFTLIATSENYRDNENVIRFMDMALNKGDAVAEGFYSSILLRVGGDEVPKTVRTEGSRGPDVRLVWTASHLDGEFANQVERVICGNQIAIAPFQGFMTIFCGDRRMSLDGIGTEKRIDTIQYLIDNIETNDELRAFLGEDVLSRFDEALVADNGAVAGAAP